jgi:hypothetical protein
MTKYSGDVTLPDGRQFHVVAKFRNGDVDDVEIEDTEGNLLDADAQSEEILWPNRYDPNWHNYLWEVCVDLVCQQPPDDDDWGYP